MAWWFEIKLWKRVFLGLALGVIFGISVTQIMGLEAGGALLTDIRIVGDVFIALIRLVIIPLIFMTLVAGVLALGDPSKLGTIGLKTIFLYLMTTFFANIIGLAMGTIFRPGAGVDLGGAEPRVVASEAAGFGERILGMITQNPFEQLFSGDPMTLTLTVVLIATAIIVVWRTKDADGRKGPGAISFLALFSLGIAMASGDILVVIFSALVFGIVVLFLGATGEAVSRFFSYASDKVLGVTQIIMELAPFGVFALIAWVVGTRGVETFTAIFWLAVAVYLGCFIHMGLVYGSIIKFGLKLPFINFFRGILDAQMFAYSTSSSSATLPVTISKRHQQSWCIKIRCRIGAAAWLDHQYGRDRALSWNRCAVYRSSVWLHTRAPSLSVDCSYGGACFYRRGGDSLGVAIPVGDSIGSL